MAHSPLASLRTRKLPVAVAVLAAVGAIGVGMHLGRSAVPAGGDPGNGHLRELAADPILAGLPPGATRQGSVDTLPASYTTTPFETPGWNGPAVELRFASPAPAGAVFTWYAARAASDGWTVLKHNVLGLPDAWTRRLADGTVAYLALSDPGGAATGPQTWTLSLSA